MIALGWEASLAGKPVMPQHGDRLGFEVMIPTNCCGMHLAIFPAYLQYVDWVNLGFVGLCLKLLLEETQPAMVSKNVQKKIVGAHQHDKTIMSAPDFAKPQTVV